MRAAHLPLARSYQDAATGADLLADDQPPLVRLRDVGNLGHRVDEVVVKLFAVVVLATHKVQAVGNLVPLCVGGTVARNLGGRELSVVGVGGFVEVHMQQDGAGARGVGLDVAHGLHGLLALQGRVQPLPVCLLLREPPHVPAAIGIHSIDLLARAADGPAIDGGVAPGALPNVHKNVGLFRKALDMVAGKVDCTHKARSFVAVRAASDDKQRLGRIPVPALHTQQRVLLKAKLAVVHLAVLLNVHVRDGHDWGHDVLKEVALLLLELKPLFALLLTPWLARRAHRIARIALGSVDSEFAHA
mmetsp:Transcript_13916/g.35543  ORF Transcript_13916/g.35543 Transcript_13916/m.35543 type:complete len:302 (+) Transcript_13916:421-1326(+)